MKILELKVPPVLVFFITAALMWLVGITFEDLGASKVIRTVLGVVCLLLGGFVAVSGVREFRKAKTTVNPIKIEKASSLVNSGIYRYTRNPMYTGLLFVLVAWGCFLDNFYSLLVVFAFLIYMTLFQIKPEERTLESIFGNDYIRYKEQVRRWL